MVAKAKEDNWGPCPVCGGEVTASHDAYLAHVQKVNDDNPDIESGADVTSGITVPVDPPTGGVGICSNCGSAVGASGGEDAALTQPPAAVQAPVESPEHMDAPSGGTEMTVHEVDPDAVPEPVS
jgi:cobalamin biosynthesis protein CbiD